MGPKGGTIVVGVDGSESSTRALAWAVEQAVAENRALTLVHTVHMVTPAYLTSWGETMAAFREQWHGSQRHRRWCRLVRGLTAGLGARLPRGVSAQTSADCPVLLLEHPGRHDGCIPGHELGRPAGGRTGRGGRVSGWLGGEVPGRQRVHQMAQGRPPEVLPGLGDRMNLIVVGAHQANRAAQVVFGAVSVAVLEHANCPVAVVPVSTPR